MINYNFAEISAKKHIEGTVKIHCMVTKTGDIVNVKVLKSLDKYPGKQNGVNVPVYYVVAVSFKRSSK